MIAQRSPGNRPAILGHTHGVASAIIGRRPPIIAPIIAPIFLRSPSGYGPLGYVSRLAIGWSLRQSSFGQNLIQFCVVENDRII